MFDKRKVILGLLIILFSTAFLWQPVFAEEEEIEYAEDPNYDLEVPIGSVTTIKNAADYINIVYQFGISIIGILATVMIMYGGMKWITAAGNQTMIGAAKETITSAIIGLVLALCSYLILYTINPRLVQLPAVLIPVIEAETLPEVECNWLKQSDDPDFSEVQDSSCEAADKPDSDYKCFCNLRGNIVALARQYVADPSLYWTCCWGWAHDIYVLANVAPKTTTYEIGKAPTEDVLPGDWLYIYNGNSISSVGQHSVIFLGWTDKANLIGECAGANPQKPHTSTCDFNKTPIASILTPYPQEYGGVSPDQIVSSGYHPGVCGGMTAADLTVGQ